MIAETRHCTRFVHRQGDATVTARIPTALDDFLFDLNGYLILKNAVGPELLAELNAAFNAE